MLTEEREVARAYNRWMSQADPIARQMRWNMGPTGVLFVNTPVLKLAATLGLRPEHRMLDIGCGRGSVLRFLARRVRFQEPPVGLDASSVMLKLGRADNDPSAPIALVAGPASSLPFAANSFDFVLVAHVWKHLDDRALMHNLLEIQRVLRPGGSCIAWEFAPVSSRLLDRWNRWVLTRGVRTAHLRGFHVLASAAMELRFARVERLDLGAFLWPPIPRVAMRLTKADEDARREISHEGGRTGPRRRSRGGKADAP